MHESDLEYKFVVKTRRFTVPGVLETLSDQSPLVRTALNKMGEDLPETLNTLDGGGWRVQSHSVSFYSGLIVATFLIYRQIREAAPETGSGA